MRIVRQNITPLLTRAGVSAAQLSEVSQPLPPLLHLLVTVVVFSSLLSEVSEHGGQCSPTHVIRPGLTALVATDGRELSNSLLKVSI